MLTFVTGLPGAGKTLHSLAVLVEYYNKQNRQVYTYRIHGIDHEYFKTIEIEDPDKWYELPEGAVLFFDEAQKVFPVRRAGAPVPRKCAEIEEHRHKGIDLVFMTQDGTLLDSHVRKLCNKHYHLQRMFGTASSNVYEYEKFQPKPEDLNTIKKAVSNRTWFFDKKIYEHYKSASLHTMKAKIPRKLIIVPFILIAAIVVGYYAISTIMSLFDKDPEEIFSQSGDGGAAPELIFKNTLDKWVYDRTPLVEGMPWTMPIYESVQEVATFPKPHCVIHNMTDDLEDGQCSCFSQQVTKIRGVKDNVCRQLASDGWFDYTEEKKSGGNDRGAARERAPASTRMVNTPLSRDKVATRKASSSKPVFTNWREKPKGLMKKIPYKRSSRS